MLLGRSAATAISVTVAARSSGSSSSVDRSGSASAGYCLGAVTTIISSMSSGICLTDGVRAFAEQLRAGGRHTVHAPDLFDGERAATVARERDLDPARELAGMIGPELAEVYTYPGDRHLCTDSSLPSDDADATALVVSRSREFLDRPG